MAVELVYSSVEEGLWPDARGFCVVAATRGISQELVRGMESLSGYRHLYEPGDPRNPCVHHYIRLTIAGTNYFILSRVSDAGIDYSGRSNKLAHHVALTRRELLPCGPAEILAHWEEVFPLPRIERGFLPPRTVAWNSLPIVLADTWQKYAGDACWARVIAYRLANRRPGEYEWFICPEDAQPLSFVRELIAQLPEGIRWNLSFSTYHVLLPGHLECAIRFVYDGTSEALKLRDDRAKNVTDLCQPLGKAPVHVSQAPMPISISQHQDQRPIKQTTPTNYVSNFGSPPQVAAQNAVEFWNVSQACGAGSSQSPIVLLPPTSTNAFTVRTVELGALGSSVHSVTQAGNPSISQPNVGGEGATHSRARGAHNDMEVHSDYQRAYKFLEVALYAAAVGVVAILLGVVAILYGPTVLTIAQGALKNVAERPVKTDKTQHSGAPDSTSDSSKEPTHPPKASSPPDAAYSGSKTPSDDKSTPDVSREQESPGSGSDGASGEGSPGAEKPKTTVAPGSTGVHGSDAQGAISDGSPHRCGDSRSSINGGEKWYPDLPEIIRERVRTWQDWQEKAKQASIENHLKEVFGDSNITSLGKLGGYFLCPQCGVTHDVSDSERWRTKEKMNELERCDECNRATVWMPLKQISDTKHLTWLGVVLDSPLLEKEPGEAASVDLRTIKPVAASGSKEVRVGGVVDLDKIFKIINLPLEARHAIYVQCRSECNVVQKEDGLVISYSKVGWHAKLIPSADGHQHICLSQVRTESSGLDGAGGDSDSRSGPTLGAVVSKEVLTPELPPWRIAVLATIKWQEYRDRQDALQSKEGGTRMELNFWLPIQPVQ